METKERAPLDIWAVVEIMGHKQLAGRVTEEPIAGTNMLRIDIPEVDGHPARTVYHGGQAIYAIHPCTEDIARAAAARLTQQSGAPLPVYIPDLADAHRTIEEARRARAGALAALPAGRDYDDIDAGEDDEGPF